MSVTIHLGGSEYLRMLKCHVLASPSLGGTTDRSVLFSTSVINDIVTGSVRNSALRALQISHLRKKLRVTLLEEDTELPDFGRCGSSPGKKGERRLRKKEAPEILITPVGIDRVSDEDAVMKAEAEEKRAHGTVCGGNVGIEAVGTTDGSKPL